jgi:hypothetical protein
MTKSTAARNYAGRPSPWNRMSAKYPNRLTQGPTAFFGQRNQKGLGYRHALSGQHLAVGRLRLQQSISKKCQSRISLLYQMVIGVVGFTCKDPVFAIRSPQIWPHLAALLVRALLGFATFTI